MFRQGINATFAGLFSLLSRKRVLLSGGGGGGGGGGGKCLNYLFLRCPLGSRADAGHRQEGGEGREEELSLLYHTQQMGKEIFF